MSYWTKRRRVRRHVDQLIAGLCKDDQSMLHSDPELLNDNQCGVMNHLLCMIVRPYVIFMNQLSQWSTPLSR